MESSDAIIKYLGGTGVVAAALGQSDSTVSGWRKRGIPGPHWAALAEFASSSGKRKVTLKLLATLGSREEVRA